MTTENSKPIEILSKNCDSFFSEFLQKHKQHMNCVKGCSQCCHADFSIFQCEAEVILEWISLQTPEVLEFLKIKLQNHDRKKPEFEKTAKKPCPLLVNQECSIYPVRPIICRTQGMLLMRKTSDPKTQQTFVEIDHCPLNFKEKDSCPDTKEALDLNRLTSLQTIAENQFQKNKDSKFKNQIDKLKNKEGRVPLQSIYEYICHI